MQPLFKGIAILSLPAAEKQLSDKVVTSDTAASYLTHNFAVLQAPTNLSHYGLQFYNVTTQILFRKVIFSLNKTFVSYNMIGVMNIILVMD